MLKQKGMSGYFWGEAVSTAIFILNRAPTRALDGKIPFEAWHTTTLVVHYLHTFGCVAYAKIKKLNQKSWTIAALKLCSLAMRLGQNHIASTI